MTSVYKKVLICFFLLISYGLAYSQVIVTGVVKGADDGQTIPGVSVFIKGTKEGVVTDALGKFKISAPADAVLRFSFVGYVAKDVKVNGRTVIDVTLAASQGNLNDVVVVGYHSVKQKTTTAAITVISGKEIEDLPAPSFDVALQGKVTGVNIQNFSGQPGVRNTFVVRGNSALSTNLNEATALSTPLFIIDGVPTSLSDLGTYDNTSTDVLAGININDIESIQIAKDAAATAIWGSRGANGVVTIITKKAKKGKPQITFNAFGGASFEPALQPTATGSLERDLKIDYLTGVGGYGGPISYGAVGGLPQMLTDSLNPAFNNASDWQKMLYRTGLIHNEDLSVAGATDQINYRFSLNDYNENGVLYETGFHRYAFRTNIDYQVTPKLGTEINFSFSRLDRQPGLGNDPHEINPLSGYNQPSSLYDLTATDIARYQGNYSGIRDQDRDDLVTAFIGLHYQITPKLLYKVEASVSSTYTGNQYSQPSTISPQGIATASDSTSTYLSTNINNILQFSTKVGKNSNFSALVLQNFQRDVVNTLDLYGGSIPNDNIEVVQGVPTSQLLGSSDYQAASLLSYATQVHYDYKEKYLLDATMRADASSRFGANHKWGYFPSVSAGYIMSDEDYLKDVKWLSLLKLRGSYGVNGDQPDQFYAPYNGYNLTQGYYNGIPEGTPNYNTNNGVTNKNYTWEPTKQLDLGIDASFLDNRIDVTVDYYNKIQSNKYYTFPLAFYTGYTQQTSNSGLSVGNKGFEFNIDTHNLPPTSKLKWTTNFNFSYNSNKILSLPNGNRTIYADYIDPNTGLDVNYIFEVGKPLYVMNQMIYQGVYNNQAQIPVNPYTGAALTYFKGGVKVIPGYPIWKDVNGDYDVWSDEDRGNAQGDLVPTGDPNPKITGGFSNNFSYKNFSLGFTTTFTLGRTIINTLAADQLDYWSSGTTNFTNAGIPNLTTIGFWNPSLANKPGYNAKYPALSPNSYYFYQFFPFSTMYNENGAYFKIVNISVGYKLPQSLCDKLKITSCRFYGMLENIATFQKASVPDAEQVNPFGEYDGATYPVPKKATLGVTVQF